jgi:hypothetical protein
MMRLVTIWMFAATVFILPAVHAAQGTKTDATLRITDVRLTFDNQKGERTVQRRHPRLQAFAEIHYKGAGPFEASWIVDGKFYANVARHFSGDGSVRIASPDVPGLPTCCEGLHVVVLRIQKPAQDYTPVRGIYFVTASIASQPAAISLGAPADGSVVALPETAFVWSQVSGIKTYLIEFIEDNPERPVASAFIEENRYRIPAPVARLRFLPGRNYIWRVQGFSETHEFVAESPPLRFRTEGDSRQKPSGMKVIQRDE